MNKKSLYRIISASRWRFLIIFLIGLGFFLMASDSIQAQALPKVTLGVDSTTNPKDFATTLQILFLLTILSLAPAILLMMTSFIRIVTVLSFLRNALGTQQMPPNQVVLGLSLFLTYFIMSPTLDQINQEALQPYLNNRMTQRDALKKAEGPIKSFMMRQTREKDLALFIKLLKEKRPARPADVPLKIVIPAFVISELKTAFEIGFIIYVPFLVIDMVVAGVLMSMGMLMLPPVMISLPFKILLFVLIDGWNLVIQSLLMSFK
ncbi:MAG: flagellar type III secretion system pore protein FliP [Candidatus Delongbacteria bacterium]|nr:flagellar type III secretion system pore protein FliP [Candidatus Delongbacteria bacterium]